MITLLYEKNWVRRKFKPLVFFRTLLDPKTRLADETSFKNAFSKYSNILTHLEAVITDAKNGKTIGYEDPTEYWKNNE